MISKLIDIALIIYVSFGIIFSEDIPDWYIAITLFTFIKWVTNYRKCTLSYIEVKLRGVRKEQGVLYQILDTLMNVRNRTPEIYFIYLFQIAMLTKHYSVWTRAVFP